MNTVSAAHTAGTRIASRYTITRLLGAGGMGIVYEVLDSTLGDKPLALKLLYPHLLGSKESFLIFRREVLIARRLSHRNIVQMFGLDHSDTGELFLTMELINGCNLRELLHKQSDLTWQDKLKILYLAARGISYAHQRGILHCDIKPHNIMVSVDGTAKVADFGIAQFSRVAADGEGAGVRGTPSYMSPEQIRGEAMDERSDVYSFGITAYETIFGTLPFKAETFYQLAQMHLHHELSVPARSEIPHWFAELLILCTHKSPEKRIGSFKQICAVIADNMRSTNIGSAFSDSVEPGSYGPMLGTEQRDLIEAPEDFRRKFIRGLNLFGAFWCFVGFVITWKPLWMCMSASCYAFYLGEKYGAAVRAWAIRLITVGAFVVGIFFVREINWRVVTLVLQWERLTGVNLYELRVFLGRPIHFDAADFFGSIFVDDRNFRALHFAGMDINTKLHGETVLHVAARNQRGGLIPYLLKHGARIDEPDRKHRTPAELTIAAGREIELFYLLRGGAAICGPKVREPLLLQAIRLGNPTHVQILIEAGALTHSDCAADYEKLGRSPLSAAKETRDQGLIDLVERSLSGIRTTFPKFGKI